MTTLITGATGFVGSALAHKLLARGETVRALVRPKADRRNLEQLRIEIATGDLDDPASLAAAIKGCDTLFHVAADYRLWVPDPAPMFRSNVEGTRELMRTAGEAGVRRIVYTSSVATLLPRPDNSPAHEEDAGSAADMVGAYKQSKHAAEVVVRAMIAEGLPVIITHPSTPIGPRDIKPTPTGKVVIDAANGRMPAYVDTGLNVVHVDDVAEGHILALERGHVGRGYILGSENLSLASILATVAELTDRQPPRLKLPHGLVMPIAGLAELWARATGGEPFATREAVKLARKTMFFSSARAIQELGYRPRPAREAIADAIVWFREHGYIR